MESVRYSDHDIILDLDGKQVSDCTITIGHDALTPSAGPDRDVHLNGTLFVCNTLKDFKTLDLKKILEKEAGEVRPHYSSCSSAFFFRFGSISAIVKIPPGHPNFPSFIWPLSL